MIIDLILFLLALTALVISGRKLVQSAMVVGRWAGLPAFAIGIVVVGIGTSLPEMITGILSVRRHVSEIVAANVIGANISNILLITGMIALLHRQTIHLDRAYLYIDLNFMLGGFLFFGIVAYDGIIEVAEAVVGMGMYAVYVVFLVRSSAIEEVKGVPARTAGVPYSSLLWLLVASAGLYGGAHFTIEGLVRLAQDLEIPKSLIALTILSLGTTLPELVVSMSALRKGEVQVAVGNVLGSCVFNAMMITPLAALFGSISVPDNLRLFALPIMAACGLFFYLLTQEKRISVWEGIMFVLLYVLFLVKISSQM